eukprot:SM000044S15917  [mRNA]  locus=s44:57183:57792:+ [translate_table: standard]
MGSVHPQMIRNKDVRRAFESAVSLGESVIEKAENLASEVRKRIGSVRSSHLAFSHHGARILSDAHGGGHYEGKTRAMSR